MDKARLDKWLWAARFFKTRAKSKQAIVGGKVHIGSVRTKASKEIGVGDVIEIRQGWEQRTVIVKRLSTERSGAAEASLLYEETSESLAKRKLVAQQRKAAGSLVSRDGRPSKKDRRSIIKFRQQ